METTKTLLEQQPSYKMENFGTATLNDVETLSIVIGGDKPMERATKLMEAIGYNLKELSKMSMTDLRNIGLTKRESQVLAAALEIGRRKLLAQSKEVVQIKSSNDVHKIMQPLIEELPNEEFWAIYLDRSNKVLRVKKQSQGGVSGTVTDVRIILKEAISLLASGIILSHNHPSGNLNPSEADSSITKKISQAAKLMDIQVLDHIIVGGDGGYYSFADNGLT